MIKLLEFIGITFTVIGSCLGLADNPQSKTVHLTSNLKFTMQYIPGGAFFMGSGIQEENRGQNEGPVHEVNINPFYLSLHEVTFVEIDACVDDGGCSHRPTDYGWGRNNQPVVDVSWDDAQEYIGWLSNKTGEQYRLPSEAEWEYAARADTTSPYWWGNAVEPGYANCDGCGSKWDDKQPSPVGSFKPNNFGLYDTAGNVWEWTQDCYHENYKNAPTDGSSWLDGNKGNCKIRMIRGGSWDYFPDRLRSAERFSFDHNFRYYNFVGFRVAKSIN